MGMNVSGASGGRRSRRAPMAEINVTPFVDVMLVLLIIFMVTAPLLVAGVPVNLPESSAKPLEQPIEPIEISIDQEGAIFIDGEETPPSRLASSLAEIAAQQEESGEETSIMLRGDKEINYGRVVLVMGELNAAGLNKISMVTIAASNVAQSSNNSSDSNDSDTSIAPETIEAVPTSDVTVTDGSSNAE